MNYFCLLRIGFVLEAQESSLFWCAHHGCIRQEIRVACRELGGSYTIYKSGTIEIQSPSEGTIGNLITLYQEFQPTKSFVVSLKVKAVVSARGRKRLYGIHDGPHYSTCHDIESKGIGFVRNIYAASGLTIEPKTQLSKIEALKEIMRAWGMNPEEILTRKAFSEPYRVYTCSDEQEENTIRELRNALKEMMRKKLLNASRTEGGNQKI